MRKFILHTIVPTLLIIATSSCSKNCGCIAPIATGITYPDSVYFGKNILSLPDSTVLVRNVFYSMGAILEKDAELTINIVNLSTDSFPSGTTYDHPRWTSALPPVGWVDLGYTADRTQRFVSSQKGKLDLKIRFSTIAGKPGSCRVEFYENSSGITKKKFLKWQ